MTGLTGRTAACRSAGEWRLWAGHVNFSNLLVYWCLDGSGVSVQIRPMASHLKNPLDLHQFPHASALFEALNGWKPDGCRVHSGTIAALCLKVTGEAETLCAAAAATGCSERAVYRFHSSNEGKAMIDKLKTLHREDAGWKAFLRIQEHMEQDKNLSVSMRAAEWLAGMAGYTPVSKAEVEHKAGAGMNAGMMVIHPDAVSDYTLAKMFPDLAKAQTKH